MMQGRIEADPLDWFALRMKPPQNPNRRTAVLDAEHETYHDRAGRARVRAVTGTGRRVSVHELLLRRAGFEVFLPVRKERRRINRYSAEKQLVTYPLLADWLFVGWPAARCRWADLMALDIVSGVMGTGGRPLRIPANARRKGELGMVDLMRRWGGGMLAPDHQRYMRTHAEYDLGDQVRAVDGPFEGLRMRVVEIGGPETRAMMEALGGTVPVSIRADWLEPDR